MCDLGWGCGSAGAVVSPPSDWPAAAPRDSFLYDEGKAWSSPGSTWRCVAEESHFPLQKEQGGSTTEHCCLGKLALPGGNSGSQCLLLLHRRVITVELTEDNVKQPFSGICLLVARALGLQDAKTSSERQRALQTIFQDTIEESSYCLLNSVFSVKVRVRGRLAWMLCWEWLSSVLSDSCAPVHGVLLCHARASPSPPPPCFVQHPANAIEGGLVLATCKSRGILLCSLALGDRCAQTCSNVPLCLSWTVSHHGQSFQDVFH